MQVVGLKCQGKMNLDQQLVLEEKNYLVLCPCSSLRSIGSWQRTRSNLCQDLCALSILLDTHQLNSLQYPIQFCSKLSPTIKRKTQELTKEFQITFLKLVRIRQHQTMASRLKSQTSLERLWQTLRLEPSMQFNLSMSFQHSFLLGVNSQTSKNRLILTHKMLETNKI